jgi:hypothetical protein
MSTHEPAKDAEKTLAAVDESIQIALSAAGTATDAAQELQRLRLQVTTLIDGSKRSGMVLLYSGIIVLVIAGIILVGSILFYQRSLSRFEAITNVNREALQAIAAQIKLMGEVAHNLEEATAATGQTLIAVAGREVEIKKAIRTVSEAQTTLTTKIDNLNISNEKIPQQVKQALDEGAKASQAANNQLIEGVKSQINGLSNGELAKKIDAMIEQQKTINAKVPKPDAQGAASARARSRNREMDNAIRYP